VSAVEFLPPGGDFLVSCSRDQTIRIWDTNSGYCVQTVAVGHSDWIRKVVVNSKGTLLASGSKDESIVVWNLDLLKTAKDSQK
jgi:platelet-activating factor acetylhydrolase IB subunit alpha